MAISEQRLTLFALISEFEVDLRYQIGRHLETAVEAKPAIGNEAFGSALSRLSKGVDQEEPSVADFLDTLDLADELKIIYFIRDRLPQRFRNALDTTRKKIFDICGIRNRVMHRRPLAFDDFPTAQAIIGTFHKLSPTEFVNVGAVYELIESDQLSRIYRNVDLDEPDSLISNNLPQPDFDDTGFIGRQEKIKELRNAIDGPYPVITVLGVGGVGKTALALQVAYDLACEPRISFDAIVWLSAKATRLTGSDIQNIVGAITTSTEMASIAVEHVAGPSEGDPFDQLHRILANFKILLIIDNLETVLDDKIRSFVRNIPEGSKILFTSRVGLGAFDFTIELNGLTPRQALSYFKRVSSIWGQKQLLNLSDENLAAYIKRLNYSPLGIKWFVQAVSKGSSAQKLLADPKVLLSFCLDNILDKLSGPAKDVLNCLAIVGKDQSPASLSYLCEMDGFAVDEALTELLASNLIQVISGRFGDDDRYKIAFLAIGYISRFKAPSAVFQGKIQKRLGQLKAATERALPKHSAGYVYDPSFIYVREEFADTDAIAAQHLKLALKYCRDRDFQTSAEYLRKAQSVAPTYFEVHRVEAFISAKEGNNLLAMSSYEEALALRPDYPPLLLLFAGFLLRTQDDHERAHNLLSYAIEIDPETFQLRGELIRGLMYEQRMDEAWEALGNVDVESVPTGRDMRIFYDLSADVCKRAMEKALSHHDHNAFLTFADRLAQILRDAPKHIWDHLSLEKLSAAAALTRKFIARESGSPEGVRMSAVREEILSAIRTTREGTSRKIATPHSSNGQRIDKQDSKESRSAGKVNTLHQTNRFGFLEEFGSNNRFFFHRSFFRDPDDFDDLSIGDVLYFTVGENHQGPCATDLSREQPQ